jgi:hypothetical protein
LHGFCNSDIGEPLLANKKVTGPDFGVGVNATGSGVERMSAGVAMATGATGFIGGHVARLLIEQGWVVRALRRPGRRQPYLAGVDGMAQR